MVQTASAAYVTAVGLSQRTPCFIIRFDDDDTLQFSSAAVTASSRTTYKYLSVPSGVGQSVDFRRLKTTISAVSFDILDKGQLITALIKSMQDDSDGTPATFTPLLNQPMTL